MAKGLIMADRSFLQGSGVVFMPSTMRMRATGVAAEETAAPAKEALSEEEGMARAKAALLFDTFGDELKRVGGKG